MAALVVENDALNGARVVIDSDALITFEARGWHAVGACSDPTRDPLRSDAEQALFDASEAARLAALLNPKPSAGAAAAASKPASPAATFKE